MKRQSSAEEDNARVRTALDEGAPAVERLADEDPRLLRDYLEGELLPAWADAHLAGEGDATLHRERAGVVGEALLRTTSDAMPRDAARTLAEQGADVLMVAAGHLPQVPEHVMDTSHGKRSCFLDLNQAGDRATIMKLVRNADVFSQGYRPGIMEKYGLTPEQLAEARPGIVYLSISCYGHGGPFSNRGGWEQIAQCTTGICLDNGDERPKLLPASACDYTTGYNGAYGVLLALARRAREGGSYHVRVSLCRSGMYIYKQGHVRYPETEMGLSRAELDSIMIESKGGHGTLKHLAPVLSLSETRPYWDKPSPVLGSSRPEWLS